MSIVLERATESDIKEIWKMQVEAFKDLLEKYKDYDISPATESSENILNKYNQPWTKYFFIVKDDNKVGVVRVIDREDGSRKRIAPLWIMPSYRNKGFAQLAIKELEKLYGSSQWELDTILQEKGNIYLSEKLGYRRIDKIEHIKDGMDIVFFQKD